MIEKERMQWSSPENLVESDCILIDHPLKGKRRKIPVGKILNHMNECLYDRCVFHTNMENMFKVKAIENVIKLHECLYC